MSSTNWPFLVLILSGLVLGQATDIIHNEKSSQEGGRKRGEGGGGGERGSSKEREQILKTYESGLLSMFGMKSRPRPTKRPVVPDFMMKLYRQQMQNPEDISLNFPVRGKGTSTANTVRSFLHQDAEENASDSDESDNIVRFWFNVTIPEQEELTAAEIRIYREKVEPSIQETTYGNGVKAKRSKMYGKHRIDIYEIIQPATETSETISRLLDTRLVNVKNSKWESFDVRPAVMKWRDNPRANHGLEVHFLEHNGAPTKLKHVRLRRDVGMAEKRWHKRRPILVTYSDDGKHRRDRTRRNTNKRNRRRKNHKDQCRRHDLYVDFSDVGWNDWIVAPPGYQAFYCHGECPFPLADHLNSTNHAIVQTLVNSVDHRVPRPCCVPTQLSPISMLYLDETEKVVLKNYQEMVVEGCGCR